jgi:hypothetical protein
VEGLASMRKMTLPMAKKVFAGLTASGEPTE